MTFAAVGSPILRIRQFVVFVLFMPAMLIGCIVTNVTTRGLDFSTIEEGFTTRADIAETPYIETPDGRFAVYTYESHMDYIFPDRHLPYPRDATESWWNRLLLEFDDEDRVVRLRTTVCSQYKGSLRPHDSGEPYSGRRGCSNKPVEDMLALLKVYYGESVAWEYESLLTHEDQEGWGVSQDDVEAVRWYRKAAEGGDAKAQYNLGFMYQNGRGVNLDHAEALRWYRKAAEQGDAQAQLSLGLMYGSGQGVYLDYAEEAQWYRKAAEQGNAQAQFLLGLKYRTGQGVSQDVAEAARWIRKAAEQGDINAQTNLGFMYENGWGVPKDDAEAARWYRKAVEKGGVSVQNYIKLLQHSKQPSSTEPP